MQWVIRGACGTRAVFLLSLAGSVLWAGMPEVENYGADWVRRREAQVRGELTSDGGEETGVWVEYWPQGGSPTSSVLIGILPAATSFQSVVTGLNAGTAYTFRFGASNSAGSVWSLSDGFVTLSADPIGWYVTTNGPNGAGTNWSVAFGTVSGALAAAESGDTIYVAGGTYWLTSSIALTAKTNISLLGSYAATNALEQPGPWDLGRWPTVLRRDSAYRTRIMHIHNSADIMARGLILREGYPNHHQGGGLYVEKSSRVTLERCGFLNNRAQTIADHSSGAGGGAYIRDSTNIFLSGVLFEQNEAMGGYWHSRGLGGGLYTENSLVKIWESFFSSNQARTSGGNASFAWGYGGGIFQQSGTLEIGRTVLHSNLVMAGSMPVRGGGLFVNSGMVQLTNVLVVTNRTSSSGICEGGGIYQAGGTVVLGNVTVANNGKEGIRRQAGTLAITNSIVWYNGTRDLVGQNNMLVSYTAVEAGKSDPELADGWQGCTTNPPRFMDVLSYHKASEHGVYVGGFFNDGTWTNASETSLLIDAGDPSVGAGEEPNPNGQRINLGAYGGTPVASKSPPMRITNLPAIFWDEESVFLNARVLNVDSPPLRACFFYGRTNGGTDSNSWEFVWDIGELASSPWEVSTFVQGLTSGETYYATLWVRNQMGEEVWGEPVVEFIPQRQLPLLENTGVEESGTHVTLQGNILRAGSVSPPPSVWIVWGPESGGKSVSDWPHQIALGTQTGRFETVVEVEVGSNYWFTSFAVNGEGTNWAPAAIPFGWEVIRFVDTTATGNGSGYNWLNAYARLEDALAACTFSRTNVLYLKGGMGGEFKGTELSYFAITVSHVRVLGGCEGMVDNGIGARDSGRWPTVLTRSSFANNTRPLSISNATDVAVDGVTLLGGETVGNPGGGLRIERARDIRIVSCRITSNRTFTAADHSSAMGGGMYVLNSTNVMIQGTTIASNEAVNSTAFWHGRGRGGGVFIQNSTVFLTGTVVEANRASTGGGNSTYAYAEGGGLYVASGTAQVDRTVFWSNHCHCVNNMPARGGGIFMEGGMSIFENTLVSANQGFSASVQGGGFYQAGGTAVLYNVTVADNVAEGYRRVGGSSALTNCIVWGHSLADITGTVAVGYSCVGTGGDPGHNGNISLDPEFRTVEGAPYGLAPMSPCVDAGFNLPWQSRSALDLADKPRIKGRRVDMGAFENQTRNAGTVMTIR